MACSGCLERQRAIIRAAQAARRGDIKGVTREGKFVSKSAVEDIASIRERLRRARKSKISSKET